MGIVDIAEQGSKISRSVFERICNDAFLYVTSIGLPVEGIEWFYRNINFNVSDGKSNNIMSVKDIMEILLGRTLSDDEYFKAAVLEWCIIFLQASRSHIYPNDTTKKHRKGQCWYMDDDIVIHDLFWLGSVSYYLITKYFRSEAYYVDLLELFQDTTFQTGMGQLVKSTTISKDHVDLNKFSLQKHALITRSKTTSFYFPIAIAMCVCGVSESYTVHGSLFSPYTTARSISLLLCEYCQVQDDFLNYVGAVGKAGKGSDITENKCSWCIITALVVSSAEERKSLEENYGRDDPEEGQVKRIYESIGLREQYRIYEANMKERIEGLIVEIPEPEGELVEGMLKREVFSRFFNKIYKRTKKGTSTEYLHI